MTKDGKEKINLAFSIDDNYCGPLFTVLFSIFSNFKKKDQFHIHINVVTGKNGVTKEHQLIFEEFVKKNDASIQFIVIDSSIFGKFHLDYYITENTYYKIILPELLPNESKVLYLDSDILVVGDISELWSFDVSNWALAAAADVFFDRFVELGIPVNTKYFNSGIILMNLNYWRANDISRKVFDFININNDKLLYHDQDVLNALLYSQWLYLHPKYNSQSGFFYKIPPRFFSIQERDEAVKNPFIVHFNSNPKPWFFGNVHPLKRLYKKYAANTPAGLPVIPDNPKPIDVFKKLGRTISPIFYIRFCSMLIRIKKAVS